MFIFPKSGRKVSSALYKFIIYLLDDLICSSFGIELAEVPSLAEQHELEGESGFYLAFWIHFLTVELLSQIMRPPKLS
jgi:hypothetical protein